MKVSVEEQKKLRIKLIKKIEKLGFKSGLIVAHQLCKNTNPKHITFYVFDKELFESSSMNRYFIEDIYKELINPEWRRVARTKKELETMDKIEKQRKKSEKGVERGTYFQIDYNRSVKLYFDFC